MNRASSYARDRYIVSRYKKISYIQNEIRCRLFFFFFIYLTFYTTGLQIFMQA